MNTTSTVPSQNGFLRVSQFIRKNLSLVITLLVLILFPFVFGLLSGSSATSGPAKFWQGQLIAFFIMAILAMSYDLLMGYIGLITFGQAAFFGGGAYAMGLFLKHVAPGIKSAYLITFPGLGDITDGVLLIAGFLLAILAGGLLGLLFSALSARVKGIYFAMITLAAAEAIYILSKASDFIKWTGADEGLQAFRVPEFINPTQNRLLFYFLMLAFLVGMYLLLQLLVNSPTGRIFQAIRENPSRVEAIGLNPVIFRTIAFVVSGITAALAGSWYAIWNLSVSPSTTTSAAVTINALIMTILGGVGTLIGPILGAGLMQIIGYFFAEWFGPRWPLVFGVVFVGLVLFLPYGIVGTYRMRKLQWKEGWLRLLRLFNKK